MKFGRLVSGGIRICDDCGVTTLEDEMHRCPATPQTALEFALAWADLWKRCAREYRRSFDALAFKNAQHESAALAGSSPGQNMLDPDAQEAAEVALNEAIDLAGSSPAAEADPVKPFEPRSHDHLAQLNEERLLAKPPRFIRCDGTYPAVCIGGRDECECAAIGRKDPAMGCIMANARRMDVELGRTLRAGGVSDSSEADLARCEQRLIRTNEARHHWRERAIAAEQALGLYGGPGSSVTGEHDGGPSEGTP